MKQVENFKENEEYDDNNATSHVVQMYPLEEEGETSLAAESFDNHIEKP